MAEDTGGGYVIGTGVVAVELDLSAARSQLESFKGEVSSALSGVLTAPVGAGGGGASAAAPSSPPSPAGGTMAGGFSGLPPITAANIGAGASFGAGSAGGYGGGGKVDIDTGGASDNVKRLSSDVKELRNQLELLESVATGFSARGAVVPGNVQTEIDALRSKLGGGGIGASAASIGVIGAGGAAFTRPYHGPAVLGEDMYADAGSMGLGAPQESFIRPFSPRPFHGAANPAGMYGAVTMMGLGAAADTFMRPGSNVSTELRPGGPVSFGMRMGNVEQPGYGDNGGYGEDFPESMEAEADRFYLEGKGRRAAAGASRAGQQRSQGGGFGIFGAFSRATGIPYAGVLAGVVAYETASHIVDAAARHDPDSAVQGLYSPGSDVNLANDPRAAQATRVLSDIEQFTAIDNAIPFGTLAAALTGQLSGQARIAQRARQIVGTQGFLDSADFSTRIAQAQLTGTGVDVAQAQADQRMAPFFDAYIFNQTPEALAASERMNQYNQGMIAKAKGMWSAESGALSAQSAAYGEQATASYARAAGQRLLIDDDKIGAGKAHIEAMKHEQTAALGIFDSETRTILSGINNNDRYSEMVLTRASKKAALVASQANELEGAQVGQQISERDYNSGVYYGARDAFSEHMAILGDAAARFQSSAISNTVTGFNNQATALSASGDQYGAAMAGIAARRAATAGMGTAPDQARALSALQAEESGLTVSHNFEHALLNENLNARYDAANAESNLQPINAEAIRAVANARQEVARAAPEDRAMTKVAVWKELQAREDSFTAQRGGATALDTSLAQARGMVAAYGVDLTGRGADIAAAQKTIDKGQDGLDGAPNRTAMSKTEFDASIKPIINFVQKFVPTAVSFLAPG